jgi:hypothetical protein
MDVEGPERSLEYPDNLKGIGKACTLVSELSKLRNFLFDCQGPLETLACSGGP